MGWFILGILALCGLYILYTLIANEASLNWIEKRRDIINESLAEWGYEVYISSWFDNAPCEVRFYVGKANQDLGYFHLKTNAKPSRFVRRWLEDVESGKLTPDELYEKFTHISSPKEISFKVGAKK